MNHFVESSFLASNVNRMVVSKMKIWRISSIMRAFNFVSKSMMLINMFRTEHPAAAFRARGTPCMDSFFGLIWRSNHQDSCSAFDRDHGY